MSVVSAVREREVGLHRLKSTISLDEMCENDTSVNTGVSIATALGCKTVLPDELGRYHYYTDMATRYCDL